MFGEWQKIERICGILCLCDPYAGVGSGGDEDLAGE